MPDVDTVMHGQVVPEDADSAEVVDRDRLAEIARVSTSFGVLMYEMLISRPDIAAAVGAFAAGLIGRSVADSSSEHWRDLQDLQGMCVTSTSHLCVWIYTGAGQPDAHDRRQPVGVG